MNDEKVGEKKFRLKSIDNAIGWEEFFKEFNKFVKINNFSFEQHQIVMHCLNSMYMLQYPIEEGVERE